MNSWLSRFRNSYYWLVVGVLVLPLWTMHYALTQDGPMHMHNARILLDLWSSKGIDFYREYYVPNFILFPYWAGHLGLAALLTHFDPETVEKIFLSICILLYAVSLRRLVTAVNPDAGWVAFLGLPLFWNRTFQMGFIDFTLSVGVMLVLLAYCLRSLAATEDSEDSEDTEKGMSWARAAGLSLLFVALYFCHPTTYLFCVGTVIVLTAFADRRQLLKVALAIAPSFVLFAQFFRHAPNYAIAKPTPYSTLAVNFLTQSNLTAWSVSERWIAIAVAVTFGAMIAIAAVDRSRRRAIERNDAFLVAAIAALIVQLYGSARMIGFFERFQFVPLLMLLPWFAAERWPVLSRRIFVTTAVVCVVAFAVVRYPRQVLASELVEQITSAQTVFDPRSTVLTMNFDYDGRRADGGAISDYLPIFLHASEYLEAKEQRLISLNNIGGLYPMYPYMWRPDRNPFDHLQANGGIEFDPPGADFISYQARTGGTVDYIVAIGFASSPKKDHPNARAFIAQLVTGYAKVFQSPDGRVEVFRARPPAPPADRSAATLLNYSLALYQTRRFTESIDVANQVLAIEPASDRAYNNICASHNAMEQWDLAIAACNQALKINPSNQIARNNLAWANSRR